MPKPEKNEIGLVSLLVVVTLTIVMALVAVGFSKLMNNETRRSLDNELSAQAFYSAVAGLNDARAWLYATQGKDNLKGCNDWQSAPLGRDYFSSNIDNYGAAKYSCVSVNTTPDKLAYQIGKGQSVTFKLVNDPNQLINSLYFGWQNDPTPSNFISLGTLGSLPSAGSASTNGATGLLEVNLYPTPVAWHGASLPPGYNSTNSVLESMSRTYFMYPNSGNGTPGSVNYYSQNGNFVKGNCETSNTNPVTHLIADSSMCNTNVYNLAYNGKNYTANNTYYIRLTARYAAIRVIIQAEDASGKPITQIHGAQAVVDVTGQGTDVLQRISATIGLSKSTQNPTYTLQSMAVVCKGFEVAVTSPGGYGSAQNDTNISSYDYNNACASPTGNNGTVYSSPSDLPPHYGLPQVRPPFQMVTANLSSNNYYPLSGQQITLTWNSSNAYKCTPNGPNFSTSNATNSSDTFVPPAPSPGNSATYKYWVTCTGYAGTQDSNPVYIKVTHPALPQVSLYANSYSFYSGGSTTLHWSASASTTSCNASDAWYGSKSVPTGSQGTGTLTTGSYTYKLTCYNAVGDATNPPASVTITVKQLPTCQFGGTYPNCNPPPPLSAGLSASKKSATPKCDGTYGHYWCEYITFWGSDPLGGALTCWVTTGSSTTSGQEGPTIQGNGYISRTFVAGFAYNHDTPPSGYLYVHCTGTYGRTVTSSGTITWSQIP